MHISIRRERGYCAPVDPAAARRDLDAMSWRELVSYGAARGVYRRSMNRAELTAALGG